MQYILRRVAALGVAFALVIAIPVVSAQDGGDIQYNDPVVVTLQAGQTTTRTVAITQGDTVEFKLTRLTEYTYSATLVDPNQGVTPLPVGPQGQVDYILENAPLGGLYSLILQATAGSGDLLVQINSSTIPPIPLSMGVSTIALSTQPLRFRLEAPSDTTLTIESAPPAFLPGLTLTDGTTGSAALTVAPDLLPAVTVQLPAQRVFLLALDPGSQTVTLTWGQAATVGIVSPTVAPPPTATPFVAQPQTSGACMVDFSAYVNIRSGPGVQWAPPIGQASPGSSYPVTGQNGDYSWYQINYNGVSGWVSMQIEGTQAQGNCSNLPVASYPPAPVAPSTGNGQVAQPTQAPDSGPMPTSTPPPTAPPVNDDGAPPPPTYTYTPPPPPTAPPDGNANGVLDVPLDGSATIGDYVSYPNGDTEDSAGYRVSGLNQNVAFSGGQADLAISLQCSGQGTEYIEFVIDGKSYGCGQTFTRRVNADSNTGGIRVRATGGSATYVQWAAVGSAPRVK